MRSCEELLPYKDNRHEAARVFGVSERTIRRWLQHYGLYEPRKNYGPNKLDQALAEEIREKFRKGSQMKDLAIEYGVTFATISRVVHNIVHKTKRLGEFAAVTMIYNA